MRGFTVVEMLIVCSLILIVSGISFFIYNQIVRNSEIAIQRMDVQEQLAKIDSVLRRELLKAGPTSDGLTVTSDSVTFLVTIPFSKGSYGTYGSATKLRYSLNFSGGILALNVQEIGGSYSRSIQIGELDECTFSSPNSGVIAYTIGKNLGGKDYRLQSYVVLSNIK
ncbi:MAG TPA: hypothetical protein PLP64_01275 [Pseudothermotoga sp.]|nr:hypothetical protein [Pseudothermotoga sp.]HOK82840.1 hypothetical protein [Pseudothermotoga sp.]HPP69986.1 hypothetical protein [Pseudothermotoga sp.]